MRKMVSIAAMVSLTAMAVTFVRDIGIGDGQNMSRAMRWSASQMSAAADGIEERISAREAREAEQTRLAVAPLVEQLREELRTELAALRRDEPSVPVHVTQREMARALANLLAASE